MPLSSRREPASRRVKTLLVLSAIAEREGIDASDAEIDAEAADQLSRYGDEPKLREYLGSRRGRSYLRMTLRNQKLVEHLVNRKVGTDTPSDAGEESPAEAETAPVSPVSNQSE